MKTLLCKDTYKNKMSLSCKSSQPVLVSFTKLFWGAWMYSFIFQTLLFAHASHQYHYLQCFCIFPCNGNLWVSQRSSPEIIDRRHSEIVKQTTEMSVRASGHYVLPFLTILEANLLNIKEQVTSFCLKDLRKLVSQCESLRA